MRKLLYWNAWLWRQYSRLNETVAFFVAMALINIPMIPAHFSAQLPGGVYLFAAGGLFICGLAISALTDTARRERLESIGEYWSPA